MSVGVALSFLVYGWQFHTKLQTLPEGDVRRNVLPRLLAAMAIFSVGFVVYGFYLIYGFAFRNSYFPGIDTGLTHAQDEAVLFRAMDWLLASLIVYIVYVPAPSSPSLRSSYGEPLLED